MDDELPLTALAKPKKASYDDDLPLANLANPGAMKSKGRPASGNASASAGKTKPKLPTKKSSSSSSSSGSSSSSDSSSESGGKKKTGNRKMKIRLLQKKKREDAADNDEENKISKKQRTPKEQVVVDLLCRWWYCLADWPPNDPAYYEAELAKRSLRRVSIQEWEWVPEVDDKGLHKVYELSQFKGVFRKGDGEMVDIRPMDSCPSFSNFMKKDMPELYSMLVTAYENQIKDLDTSQYRDEVHRDLATTLKNGLTKIREKAHQASNMQFNLGAAAKKHKAA